MDIRERLLTLRRGDFLPIALPDGRVVVITLLHATATTARFGVIADIGVPVHRRELLEKVQTDQAEAEQSEDAP